MPGGLEMLYHAPLVTGPNPVLESAAGYYECLHDAGEDGFPHATVTGSCAGSFNPIFDEGAPMVPMGMDIDGLDQTQPLVLHHIGVL